MNLPDIEIILDHHLGAPEIRSSQPWWCHHGESTPSLTIHIDKEGTRRYHCFGCHERGSSYDYLRKYFPSLSLKDALAELQISAVPEKPKRPKSPAFLVVPPLGRLLDELQSSRGRAARQWLYARGLNRESTRLLGLRGNRIVLPYSVDDELVAIRYRKLVGHPKYYVERGSTSGPLFPYGSLSTTKPVFLCEGEFDSLLLSQEAGDLIQATTLGSASTNPTERSRTELMFTPRVYVCGDNDEAGDRFRERICESFRNAVPVFPPYGKDVTDSFLAGKNLRRWVKSCLASC